MSKPRKVPPVYIATRVDPAVHKKLVDASTQEGISVADYLRRLVLQSIKEVRHG